eukprot:TRINITY_DN23018_c0_g1_i13.p1 TRINITY_DN23018_c0_g1~~TRINITY_DN23018_c0_g1_i13.p1  ORF type:complete len:321 (-),score=48.77 TRINITY_DN23018_c0_g1_i13:393-1355(-)
MLSMADLAIVLGFTFVADLLLENLEARELVALRTTSGSPVEWAYLYKEWISRIFYGFHLEVQPHRHGDTKTCSLAVLAGRLQRMSLPLFPRAIMVSAKQADMLSSALSKMSPSSASSQRHSTTVVGLLSCDVIVENGKLGPSIADFFVQTDEALNIPVNANGEDFVFNLDFAFDQDGVVNVSAEIIHYGNKPETHRGSGLDAEASKPSALNAEEEQEGVAEGYTTDTSETATSAYLLDLRSVSEEVKLLIHGEPIYADAAWRPTQSRIHFLLSESTQVDVPVVVRLRELRNGMDEKAVGAHSNLQASFPMVQLMNLEPCS